MATISATNEEKDLEQGIEVPVPVKDAFMEPISIKDNLFREVHDALNGAFLMFCLPDLKALARQGLLKGDAEMLNHIRDLPVNLLEIVTIYEQNKDLLTAERLKCGERADMYHAALTMEKFPEEHIQKQKEEIMKKITLHVLDDEKEEEECVYAIGSNSVLKRVTVAFRGSVTPKDFQQDAKALLTYIENPIKKASKVIDIQDPEYHDLPEKVGLHLGFKEYLYGNAKEIKEEATPKCKLIMDKVAEIMQANPDYELRIVGHSLGGALTTVLALEAAGDDRIPGTITAITSGAPKVGNLDFQTSFQYAEEKGRIRCIQVANNKDPVTKSPPTGNFDPISPFCCQSAKFRHVGLRLMLVPDGFIIWYPMKAKSYPGILYFDLRNVFANCCLFMCACIFLSCFCNVFAVLSIPLCCCGTYKFLKKSRHHHTQLKYIRRLEFCQEKLSQLTLDQLNEERFDKAVYAMSRVLVRHKTSSTFHEAMFDSAKSSVRAVVTGDFLKPVSSGNKDNEKVAEGEKQNMEEQPKAVGV